MDGKKSSALDRARADLAAGRPDLARDRVQGFLHSQLVDGTYSEETYLLLGEIYFEMRDFARAGAAWLLTERSDANAQKAIEAFHQRYGTDTTNVVQAIKPRSPSELYPPKVKERLLQWNYRYLPYRLSPEEERVIRAEMEQEPKSGVRPIEAGCIIAVIIGVLMTCMYLYLSIFGRRGH